MNEQPSVPGTSGSSASNKCNVEDLLNDVNAELSRVDALKLTELKSELEQFIQDKKTANTQYQEKYDEFRRRWETQASQTEKLRTTLDCACPNWKELIKSDVCPLWGEITKLEDKIKHLKDCKGTYEKKRDAANEELADARTAKEKWKNAVAEIDKLLNLNQTWINEIQELAQQETHVSRIFVLWCQLIPALNDLRPSDKPEVYQDETCKALCGGCDPHAGASVGGGRQAPWIIDKEKYLEKLDSAFCEYKSKRDAYAQAVADFEKNKDDLKSLTDNLTVKKGSLKEDVTRRLLKAKCK